MLVDKVLQMFVKLYMSLTEYGKAFCDCCVDGPMIINIERL